MPGKNCPARRNKLHQVANLPRQMKSILLIPKELRLFTVCSLSNMGQLSVISNQKKELLSLLACSCRRTATQVPARAENLLEFPVEPNQVPANLINCRHDFAADLGSISRVSRTEGS